MKIIAENVVAHLRIGPCKQAVMSVLVRLWDVYSVPSPAGKDILILMCLCLSLAVTTGCLLYHWLANTLKYQYESSVPTACVYSAAVFLVSFLCHPLRCVLTMTLPTVCTKQGRKLLISASIMILILNVVPNITVNVGAAARLLKCTAEGFTKTLLNSSEPFNMAKQDLVKEFIKLDWQDTSIIPNLRKLDQSTRVDVSEVKDRITKMLVLIEGKVTDARNTFKECKLLSNRILAAIFVVLLIYESSQYLKSYLMLLQFDNDYISKDLQKNMAHAAKGDSAFSRRCNITSQECTSSLVALAVVTLYFIAIALIVLLDHVVYQVVQAILPWLLDFPPTTASISVSYTVNGFFYIFPQIPITQKYHQDYKWTFDPEPSLCDVTTSAPSQMIRLLLGCLWLMSYALVFLEVYARRLRRRISASFFRKQEKKRMNYMMAKIQGKLNRKAQREAVSVAVHCS